MSFEQADQARAAANAIRVGTVVEIDAGATQAIVDFGDLKSPMIDVGQMRAGALQFWWMPTVGEQVLVSCPNGEIAQGIITCSIVAGNAPGSDAAVPQINLNGGRMVINGTLELTGDVIASGVSLVNHTHSGVVPGGGNTGAPNT